MNDWVSYGELADQYEQAAKNLETLIDELKVKIRTVCAEEKYRIRNKIEELYKMHGEALHTAFVLRDYSTGKDVTP